MRKTILLSVLLIGFSAAAYGQAPVTPPSSLPFTLKPLGNNVWAAIDDAKGDAGANAGFVIGDNGVAVIDTFEHAAAAKQLLAEIQKLTKLPVKYVINTHYHLDHVAGNGVFAETGAVIVAHRNVRGWIRTENLKFFGKEIKPEQKAMVEGLLPPDITYDDHIELYLGSRRLLVHSFPGHTGGDSVVSVPDAKVVFCGDLFWRKTLPNLIDASTDKWTASLAKITAGSPDAAFVPGHGDVGNAADVREFSGYLEALRSMAAQPVRDGLMGDALVNAVLPELKEKYGSWNFFQYFARPNILDMARELRGDKRLPPSSPPQ
jgi:glyoxylase-like metal-dependent hydrolase (beta-lactamase superfamily II)